MKTEKTETEIALLRIAEAAERIAYALERGGVTIYYGGRT